MAHMGHGGRSVTRKPDLPPQSAADGMPLEEVATAVERRCRERDFLL